MQVTLRGSHKLKRQPGCLNPTVAKFQWSAERKQVAATHCISVSLLAWEGSCNKKEYRVPPLLTLILFAANLKSQISVSQQAGQQPAVVGVDSLSRERYWVN